MAKEYEAELANMSPKQMKIYLMKFDEEEQQRQQQYAMFQQANEARLQQAMAANRPTQQAYAAINQEEDAAAAQGAAAVQCAGASRENRRRSEAARDSRPLPGRRSVYRLGGIHYHYHLYPYAADPIAGSAFGVACLTPRSGVACSAEVHAHGLATESMPPITFDYLLLDSRQRFFGDVGGAEDEVRAAVTACDAPAMIGARGGWHLPRSLCAHDERRIQQHAHAGIMIGTSKPPRFVRPQLQDDQCRCSRP